MEQKKTSPYLMLRLKRKRYGTTSRVHASDKIWVLMLYGGCWRRIKACKNEDEAIDCLCDIANKYREQFYE